MTMQLLGEVRGMSGKNQTGNFENPSSHLPIISTDKLNPNQFNVVPIFVKKMLAT
jgi:hypothetical protein